MPFYLKAIFLPIIYISYGQLILIMSMLWKTLPKWFSKPKEVEKSDWWLNGRAFFKKYTKDLPTTYITAAILALVTMIIPISIAYYAHFIDNSIGYTN